MRTIKTFWYRINCLFSFKQQTTASLIDAPTHGIDFNCISKNASHVLRTLQKAGHDAFLVGGGVRDLMLRRHPKDFDIATCAHPETIRRIFKNSRIVGRRFKLVHIYFRDEIIEVSTFRAAIGSGHNLNHSDNNFGSLEEDTWRRDFTVNALYLNIKNKKVIDFTNGQIDLQRRLIRVIGDPTQRFHEDPVRILRAIRLAAKLNFSIEGSCETAIFNLAHLLQDVSPSRLFDEVLKLFFAGHAQVTFDRLRDYNCFTILFPYTASLLKRHKLSWDVKRLIVQSLFNTDYRIQNKLGVNPGFLLAVILWPVLSYRLLSLPEKAQRKRFNVRLEIDKLLKDQRRHIMIPKRFIGMIRDIWQLQNHMERPYPRHILRIANHRYFRAAVDFIELRVVAGEPFSDQAKWWRQFRESDIEERLAMKQALINAQKNK